MKNRHYFTLGDKFNVDKIFYESVLKGLLSNKNYSSNKNLLFFEINEIKF